MLLNRSSSRPDPVPGQLPARHDDAILCTVATEGAVAVQDSSAPLEQQAQPGLWCFGQAVLDEQVAVLRVSGTPVELDRSAYDVLLALLRHAGEIVTKDELLDAGWPGRI